MDTGDTGASSFSVAGCPGHCGEFGRSPGHQIPVAPQCDSQHGLWTLPHVPGGRVGPGRLAAAEDQGEDDTHERSQRSPLCTAGMNPRVPPPPLGSSSQGSSPFLLSLH